MKRDDFIRRWRAAWLSQEMDVLAVLWKEGPGMRDKRVEAILETPARIDGLLGRIYDELQPPANGPAQPQRGKP